MWLLWYKSEMNEDKLEQYGATDTLSGEHDEHNARLILLLFTNLDPLMLFSHNNAFGKPENQVLSGVLTYCMENSTQISPPTDPRVTFSSFLPSPPPPPYFTCTLVPDCCCYSPLWKMRSLLHIKTKVSVCVAVSTWKIESCQINEKRSA